MPILLLVFLAVQFPEPPILPQGWTGRASGAVARLEHSSGASLLVTRPRPTEEFNAFARHAVERLASPLGFARIGEPRHFSDPNQEWFEYQIRGNRLSERRRILYRLVRSDAGFVEIIYENSENRFDALLSEALSIPSSLELESVARHERPDGQISETILSYGRRIPEWQGLSKVKITSNSNTRNLKPSRPISEVCRP